MGYCRLMGYGVQIPANRVGERKRLWGFRVYGLSGVWAMGVLTVYAVGYGKPDSRKWNGKARRSVSTCDAVAKVSLGHGL